LGCGRGILLALVVAARAAAARGELPAGWPSPPMNAALHGIEARPRIAAAAAAALAGAATIEVAELTTAPLPPSHAVLLLDVLHYLPAAAQEHLLARAAECLEPGGVLLVREADAAGGARFLATRTAERLCALARGHLRQRFRYRSVAEWRVLLEEQELEVAPSTPLATGTPYANVLFKARRPAAGEPVPL
ncbi:MAG TPA: class I SAM-dependent methyltransferase, partial [Thermoanaerobaculia bacterium]